MVNFTMLVHNRPRLTKQALDSVGASSDMNAFILNDRCDSETSDVINLWAESKPGRSSIYQDKSLGTGTLRNVVISESELVFRRGDFLYLSDNDVFFHEGWLERLIEAYEESWKYGFKVLGAYNHPYHLPIEGEQWVKVGDYDVKPVLALALQSMLMRWEVWDKYGPFKQTPVGRVCQGEDVDFGNAIRADGGRLGVISPPLLVNCGITNSFGEKIPGWDLVAKQAPAGVIVE